MRLPQMIRVFIVEDDILVQDRYKNIFKTIGYKIVGFANNGKIAIEMFNSFLNKPDVIIMDYNIPIKNGIEVLKEILIIKKDAKVIMISGNDTIRDTALEFGAITFLNKPISIRRLKEEISKI